MALLPDDQWLLIRPQPEYNLVLLADCCGEKQTVNGTGKKIKSLLPHVRSMCDEIFVSTGHHSTRPPTTCESNMQHRFVENV